VHDVILVEYGQ
jgi:hypothetical protein